MLLAAFLFVILNLLSWGRLCNSAGGFYISNNMKKQSHLRQYPPMLLAAFLFLILLSPFVWPSVQ